MKNIEQYEKSVYQTNKKGELVPHKCSKASRFIAYLGAPYIQKLIQTYAQGHLLDLGCGKVPLYIIYKDLVDQITCVDWSQTLHGAQHVDIVADLSKKLPLETETYDTILSTNVLEHLPEPELAFQEMARILKKGGMLIIHVPFFYWIHEAPHDFYRYTQFAIERYAKLNQLEIVESICAGGAFACMSDILGKTLNYTRFFKWLIPIQQKTSLFIHRSRLGQKIEKRTSSDFPLVYFYVLKKNN